MEIKGYVVPSGYMGYVGNGQYQLFATENDYLEFVADELTERR